MNAFGGDDTGNVAGKAAILTEERHRELLKDLEKRAEKDGIPVRPVVFNGQNQPELTDNPILRTLGAQTDWSTPDELEEYARQPVEEGGLGVEDWLAGERPVLGLLGQEFNVRGFAKVVLRRRATENLVVVGAHNPTRVGLLAAFATSMAAAHSPDGVQYQVADRSVARSPWSKVLTGDVADFFAMTGHHVTAARNDADAVRALEQLANEVNRRKALNEEERDDAPSVVAIFNDLDRLGAVCRVPDEFGSHDSELGSALTNVLIQGPALGVHVVLSCSSVGTLTTIVSDQVLARHFRHRVAFQMSEDDAFSLVRNSAPSRLQHGGPRPVSALYLDLQNQRQVTFKPYSVEGAGEAPERDLAAALRNLGEQLKARTSHGTLKQPTPRPKRPARKSNG